MHLDCSWPPSGGAVELESPKSRSDAIQKVLNVLSVQLPNSRCLACFDFAFGYPRGFAASLPDHNGDALWRRVWRYLHRELRDDLNTNFGRLPNNCSNRFEVANRLNEQMSCPQARGPFWCIDPNWRGRHIPDVVFIPQKLPLDFQTTDGLRIEPVRITDRAVSSSSPFCLFRNGSVGSQTLTGIPRLQNIRESAELWNQCQVWPFETGWAPDPLDPWLDDGIRVVLAEIYPSVQPPLPDPICRDRGQVRAMWNWARDLDTNGGLQRKFIRPGGLTDEEEQTVVSDEGWVLH